MHVHIIKGPDDPVTEFNRTPSRITELELKRS